MNPNWNSPALFELVVFTTPQPAPPVVVEAVAGGVHMVQLQCFASQLRQELYTLTRLAGRTTFRMQPIQVNGAMLK